MAFDRYDTRDAPRDERSRRYNERDSDRSWRGESGSYGRHDERGFFERAGDEISSWFGDEEAERRRREDRMHDEYDHGDRSNFSSRDRDYDRGYGRDANRDREQHRGRDWN